MALNLEQSSPSPTSSFHLMCGYGEDQAVTQLIKNGAAIDAMCDLGLTPLNCAIIAGHVNIVKILVENSAQINILNTASLESALHLSISERKVEITSFLVKNGADINLKDGYGRPPLDIAIMRNDIEIAEILIESGVDVNAADEHGDTILHIAGENNKIKMVDLLIKHGANVNVANIVGETPLHGSAENGLKEITHILISNGANVNAKRANGMNPLQDALIAVHKGKVQEEIIEMLILSGTDIDYFVDGLTALHFCILNNYKDYVKILIKYGASLKIKSASGYTPLESALHLENYDLMKLLTFFKH